jgi:hypothetical protein
MATNVISMVPGSGTQAGAGAFVAPHFIDQLGCDGLTSQEIADSIGMRKDNLHTLVKSLVKSNDIQLTESQELIITRENASGKEWARARLTRGVEGADFLITRERGVNNIENIALGE